MYLLYMFPPSDALPVLLPDEADGGGVRDLQLEKFMKSILPFFAIAGISFSVSVGSLPAAEPVAGPVLEEINKICPISGKPADPGMTVTYEGRTYAFADAECRTRFNEARKNSLYQKLGGRGAIDAAVESFYVKVLADDRIKHFFDDINMTRQRRKQKEFLSAAFGGPVPWTGKDLRKAHASLPGLNDTHFNAVAEHLQKTLEERTIGRLLANR